MPDTENADPTMSLTDETPVDGVATPEMTEDPVADEPDTNTGESAGDTFPRKVVEDLRKESAGYRDRAKVAEERSDTLARQLFTARVAATGKLADATDLEFNADLLDDAEKLTEAIDALTASKPHLKFRKPSGDVGQGNRGESPKQPESFSGLFL